MQESSTNLYSLSAYIREDLPFLAYGATLHRDGRQGKVQLLASYAQWQLHPRGLLRLG